MRCACLLLLASLTPACVLLGYDLHEVGDDDTVPVEGNGTTLPGTQPTPSDDASPTRAGGGPPATGLPDAAAATPGPNAGRDAGPASARDAGAPGPCTAASDGTPCGAGLACLGGECVPTTDSCLAADGCIDKTCGTQPCSLVCPADATRCRSRCEDNTCEVVCSDLDRCESECRNSTCEIDCENSGSCKTLCEASTCLIDCGGSEDCTDIVCKNGSTCLLQCTGTGACSFKECDTTPVKCPLGWACGGACGAI